MQELFNLFSSKLPISTKNKIVDIFQIHNSLCKLVSTESDIYINRNDTILEKIEFKINEFDIEIKIQLDLFLCSIYKNNNLIKEFKCSSTIDLEIEIISAIIW